MPFEAQTAAIECMRTLAGDSITKPCADAIAHELERLPHVEQGASVTLQSGHRSMRIKYMPGRGYYVLTYRADYSIDTMLIASGVDEADVVQPLPVTTSASRYPFVEASSILDAVSSFSLQVL